MQLVNMQCCKNAISKCTTFFIFLINKDFVVKKMAELWQLVQKRTLPYICLSYYIYLPPSNFTVQLSLTKWSWPKYEFMKRLKRKCKF